jgi:L-ascorbate peroxidase
MGQQNAKCCIIEICRWIRVYAEDQARFFDDFRDAYIKLVDSGASWRTA